MFSFYILLYYNLLLTYYILIKNSQHANSYNVHSKVNVLIQRTSQQVLHNINKTFHKTKTFNCRHCEHVGKCYDNVLFFSTVVNFLISKLVWCCIFMVNITSWHIRISRFCLFSIITTSFTIWLIYHCQLFHLLILPPCFLSFFYHLVLSSFLLFGDLWFVTICFSTGITYKMLLSMFITKLSKEAEKSYTEATSALCQYTQ